MKAKFCNISILLLIFLFSCKEVHNKEISKDLYIQYQVKDSIEALLLRELIAGEGISGSFGGYTTYSISEHDFMISEHLIDSLLTIKGYIKPSNEQFNNTIKNIFQVDVGTEDLVHLVMNDDYISLKESPFQVDEGMNAFIFHLDKKYKQISSTLFLPEIINYQKYYPNIASIEKQIDDYVLLDQDTVQLNKWSNRSFDEQNNKLNLLYHRNKYLFNDDLNSFKWLQEHDSMFLQSLVLTFGYSGDEKLLKWVLDKNLFYSNEFNRDNNFNIFMSILTNRQSDGKLIINTKAFDRMNKHNPQDYFDSMFSFIIHYEDNMFQSDLKFNERAELIAYVLYWLENQTTFRNGTSLKSVVPMGIFYQNNGARDKYDVEFQQKNYYHLPNFKQYWEEAKFTGDGVTNRADDYFG